MLNMKKIWLLTAGIFLSALSQAQQKLNLKDAISIALENNYDIKLVKNDLSIAENNNNIANAGMLPVATGDFTTGGSRQNTKQTRADGTVRNLDGIQNSNLSYGVGLDWTVFDGFKMFANYERLKTLEEQGKVNYKGQILLSIANVINAYYNLAKQQQLVIAADSAIDVSVLRLSIAKSKFQIGKGSKLDVVSANVDYNTDTSSYLQQLNLLKNYKVALNELLARDVTTEFVVEDNIDIQTNLRFEDLSSQSEKLNPDLQNAIINKRLAEINLKQIAADRYPVVSVNGGYDINRNTSPTGFNTQSQARGFTYGLTASINIFNGFLQTRNERNAKIAISSSNYTLEKTKQMVNSRLATAYQNYLTSLDLVKLENGNQNLAKENLDITLAKYRLGSIAPLELREAQRNLIDVNNRFLEAQYQAKLAEITLKQISGTIDIQ